MAAARFKWFDLFQNMVKCIGKPRNGSTRLGLVLCMWVNLEGTECGVEASIGLPDPLSESGQPPATAASPCSPCSIFSPQGKSFSS